MLLRDPSSGVFSLMGLVAGFKLGLGHLGVLGSRVSMRFKALGLV